MDIKEITKTAAGILDKKKAIDVRIIDISKVSVIADYFIIAGALNSRQVKALSDSVEEEISKQGVQPKSIEGYQGANWVLLDYGDLIIHIFNQEQRLFYDLERIWSEGKLISAGDL